MNNKKLPPVLFFIFGGSGDLNYRKLTPALYNLFLDNLMPEKFNIIGIARTEYDETAYKEHLLDGIINFSRRKDEDRRWTDFSQRLSYLKMDVADEKAYPHRPYRYCRHGAGRNINRPGPLPGFQSGLTGKLRTRRAVR